MRDLGQKREWCVDLENIALGLRAAHLLHEKRCQEKKELALSCHLSGDLLGPGGWCIKITFTLMFGDEMIVL